MKILQDLPEMVREGILTEDTADKIRAFYASKEKGGGNRLFLVFGVLGSLLVGLGLFLILAHNWDDLSVGIKTVVAFLPLLLGLAASGYSLVKKADSPSWREGSGVFLFLAVGVCLALLQQIHNLPDTTGQFMLKWMLMGVPIAYVLGSSMSSILYFLGIIWIGFEYGAQLSNSWEDALFWPMALLGLPYYVWLILKRPYSHFTYIHHWIVPISSFAGLVCFMMPNQFYGMQLVFSFLTMLILVGQLPFLKTGRNSVNGFSLLGNVGIIALMLVFSFRDPWNPILENGFQFGSDIQMVGLIVLTLVACGLWGYHLLVQGLGAINPLAFVFLLFGIIKILSLPEDFAAAIFSLLLLAVSLNLIVKGAKNTHLGTLNTGMVVLSLLILCRFFDADLSFALRGAVFVLLGIGFFAVNYWMISKRKQDEQE